MGNKEHRFITAWRSAFDAPMSNLVLRIIVMFFGLICIGLGIALAKIAAMGTAPISSIPAVLTEICERSGVPVTMGMWTFMMNGLFFLLEVVLLRSRFHPIQFLQIPLFFVLSISVDVWLGIFGFLASDLYPQQLGCLLVSIVFLGFGIRVQLGADLLMSPGDAAVQVISYVADKPFSRCKVAWDVSLMCGAALISLIVLGGLYQVREGTIIASLLVGPMVRLCDKAFQPLRWLIPDSRKAIVPPLCPEVLGSGEVVTD